MARTVSETFRKEFWASETDKVALLLLDLNHDSIAAPYRFALNTEKVRRRPFTTTVPSNISAGATSWTLADTSGFTALDPIVVDTVAGAQNVHETIVVSVDSPTTITVQDADTSIVQATWKVSKYQDYLPFPFEVEMPTDVPGSPLRASIRIDNVDRQIASTLRGLSTSPTAVLTVVLSDTPDVVEMQTPELVWETTQVDTNSVRGVLGGPRIMNRSFPMEDFTPTTFPNLFV